MLVTFNSLTEITKILFLNQSVTKTFDSSEFADKLKGAVFNFIVLITLSVFVSITDISSVPTFPIKAKLFFF